MIERLYVPQSIWYGIFARLLTERRYNNYRIRVFLLMYNHANMEDELFFLKMAWKNTCFLEKF